MKKIIQTALSLLFLLPLGMQAQSVVTKELYEGTQILNSDFEDFHTVKEDYVEPNRWHSFESASGSLASMAGHHLVKKEERRTNGKGKNACAIYATSVFGVVANGTVTTGRMNAGSMSAGDATGNYAYTKVDSLDENGNLIVDSNGDQFCSILSETPTELSVWYKFKQKTQNENYPYASVSAVITNGKRYQDPENADYTKVVVAKAQNKKIPQTGDTWTKLTIPFDYEGYEGGTPKAILVTITTNATPGKGSANDSVFIDDLELVYTQQVEIPDCGYFAFTNVAQENHAVVMPDDLIGYALGLTADGNPIVTKTYKPGEVIPAGESLLLEGNPGNHTFKTTLYETGESPVLNDEGKLVDGTEFNNAIAGYKYFHLTSDVNGNTKFVEATTGLKIMRGKALLRVKADLAANNYPHVLVTPAKAGDIDDNGNVDATDVKALVNRLLGNQQVMTKFLLPDADVNNDKSTNVADVTELVNILINE